MIAKKPQNSILVLATLGVYLGLVLVGATPQVWAQAKVDKYGVLLDDQPLKEFQKKAIEENLVHKIDLGTPFKVIFKGTLGLAADGKLVVLKNLKKTVDPSTNVENARLLKLAEDGISSVSASGMFGYLAQFCFKDVTIDIEQDATNILMKLAADRPDEKSARTIASGLGTMLSMGRAQTTSYEQQLLESVTTTYEGKNFILTLAMPKVSFHKILLSRLADSKLGQSISDKP